MAKRKKADNRMAKRKKTDNKMTKKQKADNKIAKRKRQTIKKNCNLPKQLSLSHIM
jgi:hypothetical protein